MITRNYDFSTFFTDVSVPTDASRERSVSYMEHYGSRPDIDTFYLIYDVRPPIRIKWSCNTDQVLGKSNIAYEEIVFNLHPEWQPVFLNITAAAYQVVAKYPKVFASEKISYHLNLPVRHHEGHYIWLRHYTVPIEFDEQGGLAAHFSLYRYIEKYHGYLQMRPLVMEGKKRRIDLENELLIIAEASFSAEFLYTLRGAEKSMLSSYRELIRKERRTEKNLPTAQEVADFTGRPLTTIRTYNHRILDAVRPVFPLKDYETVAELAYLLEWTFGEE